MGAIISTKSLAFPKILCFFYNFWKGIRKRYIPHLNGGRSILYFLLIAVTPQRTLNYIRFFARNLANQLARFLFLASKTRCFANQEKKRLMGKRSSCRFEYFCPAQSPHSRLKIHFDSYEFTVGGQVQSDCRRQSKGRRG